MSFTYNDEGIRTSKTVNGVKHTYYLNGSQILAEEWEDKLLVYLYDASGSPIGMMYRTTSYDIQNWDVFWYEKNLQGDIVAVYSSSGIKLVTYTYDAWGNQTVKYWNGGGSTAAQYNPFRYRGYYYDTDLRMYYLQSRYYDSKICRFISPDDTSYLGANGDLLSYNLYSYCSNDPVNFVDPSGHAIESIWDIISLVASAAEVVANPYDVWAWAGLLGDVIDVVIPFVGGIGESVDIIRATVKVVDWGDDVIDTAKGIWRSANVADDIRDAVGSYVVLYKNGNHYIGKGGFGRAIQSASEHLLESDKVTAIIWGKLPDAKSSFVTEYLMQSTLNSIMKINPKAFNKIWSPGGKIFKGLFK